MYRADASLTQIYPWAICKMIPEEKENHLYTSGRTYYIQSHLGSNKK